MRRAGPDTTLALALAALAALGGCGGGDDSSIVDGQVAPDAGGGDAATLDCYAERDDRDNGSAPEPTGLSFAGKRIAMCGAVDIDHPGGELIDRDLYQVTVAPAALVVVRLSAPLGAAVDRLELTVRDAGGARALARLRAGNAVTTLALPQGEYVLGVEARSAGAAVVIPYRLEVYADDPALRCPPMTGGTVHDEVDESGAGHRANDVVEVRQSPPLLVTAATAVDTDAPDDTGQAVSAGGRFAITGLSAGVATTGDEYRDRDTFAFFTGATTNQLELRATWTGGIADLDLLVFDAGKPGEPMGTPTAALIGEEIVVTAVEPQHQYWLWVGGSRRSTTLPVSYVIHVCGREIAAAPGTP